MRNPSGLSRVILPWMGGCLYLSPSLAEHLGRGRLRRRWRMLVGRNPPARLSPAILLRTLSYRVQANALGDLDRETARALDRLAIGYRAEARALHLVDEHAALIRTIFARYLELGSVLALHRSLSEGGVKVPERVDARGRRTGGKPFSRGHLYAILANPIYVGRIPHKGRAYQGQHAPISSLRPSRRFAPGWTATRPIASRVDRRRPIF